MNTNLALATSQNFGTVQCDFWQDKENESQEFYMTREQIGRALEYPEPRKAIEKIHTRHANRLDKFSGVVKMGTPSGVQNSYLYNTKGVYEICRWSRQEKADEFMDWVWEVIDSLRTGEARLTQNNVTYSPQAIQEMMNTLINIRNDNSLLRSELVLLRNDVSQYKDMANKNIITMSNSVQYLIKLIEQQINQIMDVDPQWKKRMFDIADEVATQKPEKYKNSKTVLQEVYNKMRNVYSVVWEQEQREFRDKHGTIGQAPTMELISDKEQLRSIFEGIIENMLEPIQHIDIEDPMKVVIAPLINKTQDNSKGGNKTYRAVYKRMDVDWNNRMTRYRNSHGVKNNPSKAVLVKDNERLFKIFKKTVNDMLSE